MSGNLFPGLRFKGIKRSWPYGIITSVRDTIKALKHCSNLYSRKRLHGELLKMMNSIENIKKADDQKIINQKIKQVIGGDYHMILKYMDSKRDRDTFKAILTRITSATFMANVAGVQDKRSFQRSKDLVALNLKLFGQMKEEIEWNNNSTLTGEGRRKQNHRALQKMKLEKLRHVFSLNFHLEEIRLIELEVG